LFGHDVGCMGGCVMASNAWWWDQRSPPMEANCCGSASGALWKGCLNGSLHCGPSALRSGWHSRGGPAKPSGGLCRAGHGVCHRGHRGHRGNRGAPSRLCGLCDPLWLVRISACCSSCPESCGLRRVAAT